jgi:hypothetical protein
VDSMCGALVYECGVFKVILLERKTALTIITARAPSHIAKIVRKNNPVIAGRSVHDAANPTRPARASPHPAAKSPHSEVREP